MRLLSALAVGLLLAGTVSAQDWDKGSAAYDAGDYTAALQEFRPLAELGQAWAQAMLGVMYDNGEGVLQDYAEAAQWYRLSAEQGYAAAQNNLGGMYYSGDGVPQDAVLAHMWSNIAGANGVANGSENRGKVEKRMNQADISEAQRRARVCLASNYQDCGLH